MSCPVCGVTFTRTHTSYKPPKTCSRTCANKVPGRMTQAIRDKIGASVHAENHPKWTGGTWIGDFGTVYIRLPDDERGRHPTMRRDGYIRRYHYVWNKAHPDNPVRRGDVIHHKNENHQDDRIENLEKIQQSDHARGHGLGRKHRPESRAYMSEVQRARRAAERAQRQGWAVEECGTNKGYFRHRAAGEPACRNCRAAHSEQVRKYRGKGQD